MSFHDVISITANETEDINNITGNIPFLHDVKAIIGNKAKLFKMVYIWFSCMNVSKENACVEL